MTTVNATIEQLYRLTDTVAAALDAEDLLPDGRPTGELANLRADFHEAVCCYDIWLQGDESATYGRRRPPRPRPSKFMRDLGKEGFVFDDYRASWPNEPVTLRIASAVRDWFYGLDCAQVPDVDPETAAIVAKIRARQGRKDGACTITLTETEADIMVLQLEEAFMHASQLRKIEELGLRNAAQSALKSLGVLANS
ncbi:hypothetical protein BJD78_gp53 [Arthrobacter phage KellEzio]|uniref:Uncharacterized protein n=1 Tax=Arthrobacter phage KellEzio TaxID=1796995 RepID=A0A140G6D8_9CAUD|nr:hypothetical protein BJD78_gp53 [Arthrobacter phage KellEzio]AMM44223.1 hypothetical protein KELLEZIO_53 [Arthrobacter phage KellEzio]